MVEQFINSLFLFFVVIDPLGTVAIFLGIMPNINGNKKKVAVEAIIYAFFILIFFMFLGQLVLNYLSISLYSLKIAGGIILLLITIEMLFNKRAKLKKMLL